MRLDLLETTAKTACKNAFEDFKHYIDNALWPLTDNIVQIELDKMLESSGQKFYKYVHDNYEPTDAQYDWLKGLLKKYQDISYNTAFNYAKKKMPPK